jgi:hypothetical protein
MIGSRSMAICCTRGAAQWQAASKSKNPLCSAIAPLPFLPRRRLRKNMHVCTGVVKPKWQPEVGVAQIAIPCQAYVPGT